MTPCIPPLTPPLMVNFMKQDKSSAARPEDPRDDHEPESTEIVIAGELHDNETEISEHLLRLPQGSECTLYINSPGGSQYSALSLMSLILLRQLRATAIVTGECSSAAIWPFAACRRRLITPHSVFLFHSMRWESEENIRLEEAAQWAQHFAHLDREMMSVLSDHLQVEQDVLREWTVAGRYVLAPELVSRGVAELLPLPKPRRRKR